MSEAAATRRPIDRVEDAMREIGTLILAFTPLDAAFSSEGRSPRDVLLFLLLGLSLFLWALLLERRRAREH